MQLSLLGRSSPAREPRFVAARRFDLQGLAWAELVPSWVPEHAALFERVHAAADWELHRREMFERIVEVPRLVAALPGEEPGSRWSNEECVRVFPHRAPEGEVRAVAHYLRQLAVSLSHRYQLPLTNISLAHYRDGRDGVAYHGDKLGALRVDTIVAILSLGARRRFLMRPRPGVTLAGSGIARSLRFHVGEGDLLVLGGTCQETWEHAVPKSKRSGPRIAIMFRQAVPGRASDVSPR